MLLQGKSTQLVILSPIKTQGANSLYISHPSYKVQGQPNSNAKQRIVSVKYFSYHGTIMCKVLWDKELTTLVWRPSGSHQDHEVAPLLDCLQLWGFPAPENGADFIKDWVPNVKEWPSQKSRVFGKTSGEGRLLTPRASNRWNTVGYCVGVSSMSFFLSLWW